VAIPDYLVRTYAWAYLRPRAVRLLDREVVVNAILWGNYRRLVRAACAQFHPGEHVLQAASVYGSQPLKLADHLGPTGQLTVIDVSRLQCEHLRAKLATRANASVRLADATAPGSESYDGVCCFFLLHEMPDAYKRRTVNTLLARLKPGGRGRRRCSGSGSCRCLTNDQVFVRFSVGLELHFAFVEGELYRSVQRNERLILGFLLPDGVVGGAGAHDVLLAHEIDVCLLGFLCATGDRGLGKNGAGLLWAGGSGRSGQGKNGAKNQGLVHSGSLEDWERLRLALSVAQKMHRRCLGVNDSRES
jgi:hypothetical protein